MIDIVITFLVIKGELFLKEIEQENFQNSKLKISG